MYVKYLCQVFEMMYCVEVAFPFLDVRLPKTINFRPVEKSVYSVITGYQDIL